MSEIKIKCPRCKNVFTPDENFVVPTKETSKEEIQRQAELIAEKLNEDKQKEINQLKLDKEHLIKTHQIKEERTQSQLKEAKETIEKSQKKYNQGSNEVDGEAQEKWLEEFLEEKFPEFEVKEVKKGAKGADCIVIVKHKDQEIGKILLESKYGYTAFQSNWVDKLKADMKEADITYGIIVSTVLPANTDDEEPYISFEGNTIYALRKNKTNLLSVLNLVLAFVNAKYLQKVELEKRSHNLPETDKQNEKFLRSELVPYLIDLNKEIISDTMEHEKLEKNFLKILKDNKKRIDARKGNFNDLWKNAIELDSIPDDFLDS